MKLGLLSQLLMVILIFVNYSCCRRIKNATTKLRSSHNLNKYKTGATDRKITHLEQNFGKKTTIFHKAKQNSERKFNRDNSDVVRTSVKTFYVSDKFANEAQTTDKMQTETQGKLNRDNTDEDEDSDADSKALDVVQKFLNDLAAARKAQHEVENKLNKDKTEKALKVKPKFGGEAAAAREAHPNSELKLNTDNIDDCEIDTTKIPNECETHSPNSGTLGIAQKAANEAAAAHAAQQVAAQHASQQVRLQLADKALVSANAAEAAVAGKEAVVEELEDEINHVANDTKKQVCELAAQQARLHLTLLTSEGSKNEVAVLNKALEAAQSNERNAQQASQCAQVDLFQKQKIINHIKNYTDSLKKRLETAKVDLQNTKKVVDKGCMEACKAKADVVNDKQTKAVRRKTLKNRRVHHHYKTINVPMGKYITF